MPVLRSRWAGGRGREAAGWSLAIAAAKRSYAASDRPRSSRSGRPAHAVQIMASTVAAPAGANHHRISTVLTVLVAQPPLVQAHR